MTGAKAVALPDELPVDDSTPCPACGAIGLGIFHEAQKVPVHSCRLVASRDEAETFPTGSLRLGVCPACGFITNAAYDPSLQSYFVDYEETQGFSPHFRRFMHQLARRWIEDYGLTGKEILEVGCGKGEFLLLMCELGAGRGIGIDPAVVYERISSPAAEKVEFIKDLYSESYAGLAADAFVCRHTLEHIHAVAEFMQLVRGSLGERTETAVLFELPDASRVLRECAFWDIYYEHCSYFTAGSLARLFRTCGFDVGEVTLEYDDQYIVLGSRPGDGTTPRLPIEETPADVVRAATAFRHELGSVERRWRSILDEIRSRGGRAVIWGGGSKGVSFLTTLGIGDEIGCVVDINPYKQGMFMAGTGHEVVPPEVLREYCPDLVIVMNPAYVDEIRGTLAELELQPRLLAA